MLPKKMFPILAVMVLSAVLSLAAVAPALAHFGMVIPGTSVVPQSDRTLPLMLAFAHPFEGNGMNLERPKSFRVIHDGTSEDLTGKLQQTTILGHEAWTMDYKVGRPGMYVFAMEPQPYPEPAEDNYIIHYTKTIVSAYDEGEGWYQPVGMKTEIVPLTRPWGNYAGNVFQGVVLLDGKPAPHTRVEVEYYNKDGKFEAPEECMITQEVLCDDNGVFTFVCPQPGWWGFAGLNDADYKIQGKDVELGAVLWIETKGWKTK